MKILVIQQKMIGDVLTSSILFEALREAYPKAQLHYLIYPHTKAVVENNPFIDKLIFGKNELPFYRLLKLIRSEKYYAIIDAYSTVQTSILTSLSGAKYKIGFDKKYTRPFYTHVFSRKIQAKTNAGAAIEKRMRLLTPLIKNAPLQLKPKIFLSDAEREKAKRILIEGGVDLSDSIYMIGALGSSEKKTYPLPYLAKLLDQIAAKENTSILFNYIPSQKDQISTLIGYCNAQTKQKIYLEIYGKSLREFLALTSFCDAIIGNEGGAINMAKALNIPSFAIFSPPLNKANWNIYEDGKQNVSVHLKDFSPELFAEKSQEDLHKDVFQLYEKFLPAYIEEPLDQFLKLNTK
ncbi:glycosyltransferase family 9 protein [Zunongwangia sp. SCSIO 43204]|nr:glycosyltransferase family 9 protein [Zunongwangia sp. SCSIO 43204]UAB84048.1 glycosyltransferase family 9 protein [Zunongwangia sp. SCSIO 43204]